MSKLRSPWLLLIAFGGFLLVMTWAVVLAQLRSSGVTGVDVAALEGS